MITAFKRVMRKLTLLEVATRELGDAEMERLSAQTAREFADSVVTFNTARIKRLKTFITEQTKGETA